MKTFALYLITACCEIAGCYAFYLWLRMSKSAWWLLPAMISLAAFAWLLTLHPSTTAGRIYAAYGAIYIIASICWMWWVEKQIPDRWDILGAAFCLLGSAIIYYAPRS